ncbi:hypothetical protein ACGFZQ_44175 [Streptomyces sp. NPDC048254]|uniref:hypothetical protein n=1 Tax=Streptomyces sp. NPDC048254 TaxID=3365525 RepID=UPI00371DE3B3
MVTGVLGQLPAVLPAHRSEQAVHVGPHPPPKIHPPEAVTDPHQQLFQFRRPDIGPHIILHDKHNGPPHPKSRTPAT